MEADATLEGSTLLGASGICLCMRIGFIAALAALLTALAARPSYAYCADCDGDGNVGIGDLITGVAIVLGTADLASCAAIDADDSGSVTISELIAAVLQALDGCPVATDTPTPTPTATPPPAPQLPPTAAAALRTWLEAGSYLDWRAESAPHLGTGPHFGIVRVFVNDALFASLSDGLPQHPAGAAAVKELYGNGGSTVRGWAVMVKIQDDSDAGGGWYWFETFDTFSSGGIGLRGCTTCHSIGRDFIRIPFPLQ